MAFGSKNDRKKMLASIMDEADGEAILGQIDEEIQSADNRSVGLGSKAAEDSLSDTYENISSMKRSLGERKQSDAKASAAMQKQNGKPSIARDWLTYMFGQEEADAPEVAAKRESRTQSSPVVSIGPASDRSSLTDRAKKDERLARAVAAIKANREKPLSERDRIYLDTGELIPDDMPITYSGDQDAGASGLSQDPDSIRTDEERIEDTQFLSGSGVSIEDRFPDDEDETTTTATAGLMTRPKARPDNLKSGTPPDLIDFSFIMEQEGFKLDIYVPRDKDKVKAFQNSGPTIASGFDLGQRNLNDLTGLPPALISKLEPYLGLKKQAAIDFIKANPLNITEEEASIINAFAKDQETGRLIKLWNKTSKTPWTDLTAEQATVVASVAFQHGNLSKKTPKFWGHVTKGNWDKAIGELRNFGGKTPSRRNREADYLESGEA
jgi:hypothetical protein|tara:strand:+ start:1506 stop:2819 length:1314 start_codon:yes stop_codon:yes gene_type:complete